MDRCVRITPGKKSPSILPLEDLEYVAVSVMVPNKELAERVDELIAIGATDVMVFQIQNYR